MRLQSIPHYVLSFLKLTSKPEITVGDSGYTTFAAAVTAISTTPATLVIPPGNHVAGGVTIPVTMTLKVLRGAIFTIATGTTLTINGTLDAGLYQIFACTGAGKVIFGPTLTNVDRIYPQWWGITGTADDVAINAAIQAAHGGATDGTSGREVYLVGGDYSTAATIVGAHYVTLRMDPRATIKPAADIDVVQLYGSDFKFGGGRIDVSGLTTTFTKAAILMTEDNGQTGTGQVVPYSQYYHFPVVFPTTITGYYKTPSGYGVRIDIDTDQTLKSSCFFAYFENLTINNMNYGIHQRYYGTTGGVYFNSHRFEVVRMYNCANYFYSDTVSFWSVGDMVLQWDPSTITIHPVGNATGITMIASKENKIDHCLVWDKPADKKAITLDRDSHFNDINVQHHVMADVVNYGQGNAIVTKGSNQEMRSIVPNILDYLRTGSYTGNQSFAGNQDDIVAFSGLTGSVHTVAVTVDAGADPTAHLYKAFDLSKDTYIPIAAAQNPVITITLDPITGLYVRDAGLKFIEFMQPAASDTVKIEFYIVATASWETVVDETVGAADTIAKWFYIGRGATYGKINAIRVTITNAAEIRINRIWTFAAGTLGNAYLPRVGGTLLSVPEYANNAAAVAAGKAVGFIYRITGTDALAIVH